LGSKLYNGICHGGCHTPSHERSVRNITAPRYSAYSRRFCWTVRSSLWCVRAGPGTTWASTIPRDSRGRTSEAIDNNSNLTPTQRIQVCDVISSSLIGGVEGFDTPYQLSGRSSKLPRGSRRRTTHASLHVPFRSRHCKYGVTTEMRRCYSQYRKVLRPVKTLLVYEERRDVTTVGQWNYHICQCHRHDSSILQVGFKSFETYLGL